MMLKVVQSVVVNPASLMDILNILDTQLGTGHDLNCQKTRPILDLYTHVVAVDLIQTPTQTLEFLLDQISKDVCSKY